MNDTKTILRKLSTLDKEQSIEFLRNIERVRMDDDEIILAPLEESFEEQHEMRRMITPSHTAKYLIANGVTIQKHGRWEDYVNIKGVVRCSECNDTYIYRAWLDEGKWYYCPNCGAKMDGEEDAEK